MPEAEGMKPRGASFELQETFTHRSLLLEQVQLLSHNHSSDPAVTGKHEQAWRYWRTARLWVPVGLALLVLFVGDLEPGHPEVTRAAAVTVLMACWWITEALPFSVTALVPVVSFPALGILDKDQTPSA